MTNRIIEGVLRVSTKGVGYVNPLGPDGKENRDEAIEIDANSLNTGLPGDRVKVLLLPTADNKKTGEVAEIVERKRLEFVGVLESENGFSYLVPDDKRVYKDILIPPDKIGQAKTGEKVLARITKWDDPKKDPLGEVLEVIGPPGAHNTEMLAIVLDHGFRTGFPPAVEAEAHKLKSAEQKPAGGKPEKRLDYRGVSTFTIDPLDAKDFDDALSLKELPSGQWEVGVHIADVSHYVRPGTALDEEAQKRATSI
ncbi:MAG: RNB domain-containing ribonuclease, partial [Patescibacteria group bacterium]